MTRTPPKTTTDQQGPSRTLGAVLLGLCLCLLVVRATYTEAPIAQAFGVPGGVTDTIYSLSITGLLVLAIASWFLWGCLRGQVTYRPVGIGLGLAIFLMAGVLSTTLAADKRLAVTQMAILLGPILSAMLLVQLLDSLAKIRIVLLVIAALGVASTFRCLEQSLSSNTIQIEEYEKDPAAFLAAHQMNFEVDSFQHFLFEHRLYSRDVNGFFTTSNSAASFALMASFTALALLLGYSSKGGKILEHIRSQPLRALGVTIIVVGLLLTQSKGGILGCIMAGLLFGVWIALRRTLAAYRRSVLVASLVLGSILVVAAGAIIASYGQKHNRLPGGNSMLVRWQYWQASGQMIWDNPIGVGPGNFGHTYPKYKPAAAPESVADPHNFLLSLLAQYGPLGLLGFLVMVFGPIASAGMAAPPGNTEKRAPTASAPTRRLTLAILGATSLSILLIRPFLMATDVGGAGALVAAYVIIVLYVAPAGSFLIGFLLLARSPGNAGTEEKTDPGVISAALGCAILGVLVHNLIDFAIFEPGVWTTLWTLLACLVALTCKKTGREAKTFRMTPPLKLAAGVVTLGIIGTYGGYILAPVFHMTVSIQDAYRAMAAGRTDRAHTLLDNASMADPLSPIPLNLNGRLYLQEYELTGARETPLLEKASACFVRATEVNPDDYRNYEKAAHTYRLLGQDEEAFMWYLKATDHYPGSGRIWLGLAQTADRLSKIESAVESYQKAVVIEDAFRAQFRQMYPERETVVSRLGQENYQLAKQRIEALSR